MQPPRGMQEGDLTIAVRQVRENNQQSLFKIFSTEVLNSMLKWSV